MKQKRKCELEPEVKLLVEHSDEWNGQRILGKVRPNK